MESISRHRFAFNPVSSNSKTGPIPVTTTSKDSCSDECAYKDNGCYGDSGPINWQWRKLDQPDAGLTLEQCADRISKLRRHTLWRKNQVGDLPKDEQGLIDVRALELLVEAAEHTDGFTFTHHSPWEYRNHDAIKAANMVGGLTINLSAENLAEADHFIDMDIGPVVVALPADAKKPFKTPKGRQVIVCPASIRDDMTCMTCGICQIAGRKAVTGFPAHGAGKAKVERIFWATQV